jgi:hypothetical protein
MTLMADEILKIFADILGNLPNIPIPDPPRPEDLNIVNPEESIESKDEEVKHITPMPIPLPIDESWKPKGPISIRDEKEIEHGSPEWQAKYHPHEFLRGVYTPWDRYYIDDPTNREAIVSKTMQKLIQDNPQDYFNWHLYKKQDLKAWLIPSAESLIKKDPLDALGKEIWKYGELGPLLKELWKNAFSREIDRTINDPGSSGQVLPGILRKKIRSLAGEIATADPEFYMMYIKGKPTDRNTGLTTKEFDEKAERVYNQKLQLGDIKEPSIKKLIKKRKKNI